MDRTRVHRRSMIPWRCLISLDQPQKASAEKNQFLPSSTHWAKQLNKINYSHPYTIDVVQSFTISQKDHRKLEKKYFKYSYQNVSFALLNGWNWTKTSVDHAWAGMEESCFWALPLWERYIYTGTYSDVTTSYSCEPNRFTHFKWPHLYIPASDDQSCAEITDR
jgi:hypothetical protein